MYIYKQVHTQKQYEQFMYLDIVHIKYELYSYVYPEPVDPGFFERGSEHLKESLRYSSILQPQKLAIGLFLKTLQNHN